jgi:hypothetical protein
MFAQALETCIGILRFRKGPEDMPASNVLLLAAIGGGVLLRLLMLLIPSPEPTGNPVVLIALELGICLAGVKLALRSAGHPDRFTQTATAILGCQLVMGPALLAGRWFMLTYLDHPGMGSVARLVYVVVAVWLLAVTVRILRSATGWQMFACIMLALGIEVITLLAALTLYPPAPADPAAPT